MKAQGFRVDLRVLLKRLQKTLSLKPGVGFRV